MAKIALDGITKVFGDHPGRALPLIEEGLGKEEIRQRTGQTVALAGVSLKVAQGEVFVVMGLSGCGKSTLLRLINGLIAPTRGQVRVSGNDAATLTASELRDLRRHRVSMVFQRFGLFPHRNVIDNVAYGLEAQGIPRGERIERAERWLSTVGLKGYARAMPGELSGGMQQRVGLARALATDPEILLMDEPFGSLDPVIRRDMQDELMALQVRLSKTVLFVTHDMSEALFLGDRIAVLRDGMVEQLGPPAVLLDAPETDFVARRSCAAPSAGSDADCRRYR